MPVDHDERRKKHHVKSRDGCKTCKKRHLKCDETKPECHRCVADFGTCDGYAPPQAWIYQPSPHERTLVLKLQPNGKNASKAQQVILEGRQKKFAPKSRNGCLTCKRRRIKCDSTRPACTRCKKSRLPCDGYQIPAPTSISSFTAHCEITYESKGEDLIPEVSGKRSESTNNVFIPQTIDISPYRREERLFLDYWLRRSHTCQVMKRQIGNHLVTFNIMGEALPAAAMEFSCVRYVLLTAASIACFLDPLISWDIAGMHSANWKSQAVREFCVLRDRKDTPPGILSLVAFLSWFIEAWDGAWNQALKSLQASRGYCRAHSRKIDPNLRWYVEEVFNAVPAILLEGFILELTQTEEADARTFVLRLRYGITEVRKYIAWLRTIRPTIQACYRDDTRKETGTQLANCLAAHRTQMKWLYQGWTAELAKRNAGFEPVQLDPQHRVIWVRIVEQVDYFLHKFEKYDAAILELYMKILCRAFPLFVAGRNRLLRQELTRTVPQGMYNKELYNLEKKVVEIQGLESLLDELSDDGDEEEFARPVSVVRSCASVMPSTTPAT